MYAVNISEQVSFISIAPKAVRLNRLTSFVTDFTLFHGRILEGQRLILFQAIIPSSIIFQHSCTLFGRSWV
jgi:hypothetical protein